MWYENDKSIDKSKAIFATGNNITCILLPQIEKNGYKIIGYNWFDIKAGKYNSSICYNTVEEAIRAYGEGKSARYKIFNGNLDFISDKCL